MLNPYFIAERCDNMKKTDFTAQELAEIRAYNRNRRKKWWDSLTPDEKRAKRRQYALTAARKAASAAGDGETV